MENLWITETFVNAYGNSSMDYRTHTDFFEPKKLFPILEKEYQPEKTEEWEMNNQQIGWIFRGSQKYPAMQSICVRVYRGHPENNINPFMKEK